MCCELVIQSVNHNIFGLGAQVHTYKHTMYIASVHGTVQWSFVQCGHHQYA